MTLNPKGDLPKSLASYAHARRVGSLVFFAGQGCRDAITNLWAGVTFSSDGRPLTIDFEAQVRGVFKNVDAALSHEQLNRSAIVDVQVFLTNMAEQFPIMNKVWNEYFSGIEELPTRTTVAVKELPGHNLVEMKVIAHADEKS